jgi:hypothetical protein
MKFILLFLSSALLLNASMATILIIPRDAKVVVGVYLGLSHSSTTTEIESTDAYLDNKSYKFINNSALSGALIGVQNRYYRLSFSYDVNSDKDMQVKRYLMNYDFKIGKREGFRALVGFGIGSTHSSYELNHKEIEQDNAVLAFRTGSEYTINESNSIEILAEYSYVMIDTIGKSFYENGEYTTYNINKKRDIALRVGYSYEF